jgi:LPXTG-site transpeptidase (sortase) family protein
MQLTYLIILLKTLPISMITNNNMERSPYSEVWIPVSVYTGWLQGSAFRESVDDSELTGYVWNADNTTGPFRHINTLCWGDQVIVYSSGAQYVYQERSIMLISPVNTAAMLKHNELPWITLVTSRGYNEATHTYKYRVFVQAMQVAVK